MDPFVEHFERLIDENEIKNLSSRTSNEFSTLALGSFEFRSSKKVEKPAIDDEICVKKSLKKTLDASGRDLTSFQREFYSLISRYVDVYFPCRTSIDDLGEQIRFVVCLHVLNHVLKTRSKIVTHNGRLKENPLGNFQDQGFTRPKVLIVVPFRESVRRIVDAFDNLLTSIDDEEKLEISHRKRFKDEFGGADLDEQNHYGKFQRTSDEFDEIFSGNIDDHFRLGISVTKKSLKFFQSVYKSDILIASPLGLRTLLEKRRKKRKRNENSDDSESENETNEESAIGDFLSSIECVFIDQLDILSMQNIDHLFFVLKNLNCLPSESNSSTDFSRIRPAILNGWAKFYRQLIVTSSFTSPTFLNLFHRFSTNFDGQIVFPAKFPVNGSIRPISKFQQIFQRVPFNDPIGRFNNFVENILPRYDTSSYDHTLIYLSSYFDFVRLRNFMKNEKHRQFNYLTLSEYSTKKDILLTRNIFYHRDVRFLLMTERFHFYHRYRIKGIRHILFYDLPSYGHFYPEIVHFLTLPHVNEKKKIEVKSTQEESASCTAFYAKEDALKLAYILGQKTVTDLLNSEKKIHIFTDK